jgi:indolepyruvate ferredoxin oxidoreductase alpha subunit
LIGKHIQKKWQEVNMVIPIMVEKTVGATCFAYGYEAVARGALEAGVKVAAGFPGTPSSGALESLASVAQEEGIHVEWATNEKVAYEVAWGASCNGQRAICTMNHLGASVIMDPLKYSVNRGVRGGLVLFVGDDIGANTSAYESDSRILAHSADMPVLTPSSPNEALEMTRYAFELSEELGCPVMLRSVCQLLMTRSLVKVGPIDTTIRESGFKPNPNRVVTYERAVRGVITNHRFIHKTLDKANEILGAKGFYKIENGEGTKLGIVCCGVCYDLVKEALLRIGSDNKIALLKMNVANPMNNDIVGRFISPLDKVLVLEEGEAFIEERILALASQLRKDLEVVGRLSGDIPISGEMFVNDVQSAILKAFFGKDVPEESLPSEGSVPFLDERPLTLCGGCSHMALFYALRKALQEYNGGKYVAVGDAGCDFMCTMNPTKSLTVNSEMGGAIGMVTGAAFSGSDVPLIAVVGDGSFFHGGLNGLANAIYNQAPVHVIVADNRALANTGLQTTASTGRSASGAPAVKIDIAGLCRAMGAPYVRRIDPYRYADTKEAILDLLNAPKPAVLVAEQECIVNRLRDEKKRNIAHRIARVDSGKCASCRECMDLYCSAIVWPDHKKPDCTGKPSILPNVCTGCGVCQEVCPHHAISIVEVE